MDPELRACKSGPWEEGPSTPMQFRRSFLLFVENCVVVRLFFSRWWSKEGNLGRIKNKTELPLEADPLVFSVCFPVRIQSNPTDGQRRQCRASKGVSGGSIRIDTGIPKENERSIASRTSARGAASDSPRGSEGCFTKLAGVSFSFQISIPARPPSPLLRIDSSSVKLQHWLAGVAHGGYVDLDVEALAEHDLEELLDVD
mmetsp:Transcript_20781/g.51192  ORF Transcript_20781/g.51192 Transcript_20781/m.51192 type:complete len:200 (-) Transcript_20781:539-1138(-)